ncbi:hypothetical protein J6590_060686 [Homalodisca vitripennis]|nr:hypothetical protein J6590_060686 [Homalodisca vitripennis]
MNLRILLGDGDVFRPFHGQNILWLTKKKRPCQLSDRQHAFQVTLVEISDIFAAPVATTNYQLQLPIDICLTEVLVQ